MISETDPIPVLAYYPYPKNIRKCNCVAQPWAQLGGGHGEAFPNFLDSGDIISHVPHIFSLGFIIYWFHTNLSPSHFTTKLCPCAQHTFLYCAYIALLGKISDGAILPLAEHDWLNLLWLKITPTYWNMKDNDVWEEKYPSDTSTKRKITAWVDNQITRSVAENLLLK